MTEAENIVTGGGDATLAQRRRLVIFDFDGTLANTIDGITSTARSVMLNHGFTDESLGDLRRIVGPPFPQAFSLVYGVSEQEAEQITAEYRAIYCTLGLAGWPLYPGIEALLRELHAAGRLLAIATSKRNELVSMAVEQQGTGELFDVVAGKLSDEASTKAGTIARVIDELGLTPADAVMVGDRRFDIEAAASCGVPCVGVHYGNTCEVDELVQAGACAIAETVDELRSILLG